MRRKDKEIKDQGAILDIINKTKYITVAMCADNEPYLVTLNHGYDKVNKCLYFHCAKEGKKIGVLQKNNKVWGQALIDKGYVAGTCDHLYASVHFSGRVTFIEDFNEKRTALVTMIEALEKEPEEVIRKQLTRESVQNVRIGRIDIEKMFGKISEKAVISL